MNYLSIDYGTKRIGLAYSVDGIISPLPAIKNNDQLYQNIRHLVDKYNITKIYVGISQGYVAGLTQQFVAGLSLMLELPIEMVEEAVSTIEADEIYKTNRHQIKKYRQTIDSIAACVILNRVIS